MIADATDTDRSRFAEPFDVCIIGSGPAGITIARTLARSGIRVALMEAGGMELTEESQDVYRGSNIGQDYFDLDVARLRYFGGTSNHWAGWSRALDALDYNHKPFMDLSGWPISRLDLDPYRTEADHILDIPPESEAPDLPFRQDSYEFRRFQFRWSPPTRFAEKYGAELEASDLITLVLNANLVDIRLTDDHAGVAGAVFRSYAPDDPGFTVTAKAYCLCTGGVENARLLLNFTSQIPEGIGNQNGMVGRCFCDHPHFVLGDVVLAELVEEREFYSPLETFILEHQCLNFGMRLEPNWIEPWNLPALSAAPLSREKFAILTDRLIREPETDTSLTERLVLPQPTGQTGVLRMAQEQAQNPDSRVTLSDDRDAFGLRRVALDWNLSDLDVHTMRVAVTEFGAHLAEQGIGRVKIRPWLLEEPAKIPGVLEDEVGGKHHMSTTRMSADPTAGVVDADCKVHGLSNLYIGGSSVFASTGHCNPTYTITQLALRIGTHLTSVLQG